MIYPFNAAEAYKIAISIEENGLKFYQEASARFASDPIAELFTQLGKEESIHEATFKKMLSEVPNKDAPSVWDPNNETDMYLQMMAGMHVFLENDQALEKALKRVTTKKEAIQLAISFEKDTVIFFVQLKSATEGSAAQKAVDQLIEEEAKHLRKLAAVYKKLT